MKNKSEIREEVFKILFQLENKDLYLNDLSELDNDIFSDNIIIETLKDIKNNLKEVDLIINKNLREEVFKILFQLENKDLYLNDLSELDNDIFSDNIIIETLKDIKNNLKEVDLIINKNLREWTLSRLSKMDRQILRIATYEILFTDIPYKVSINEALEISKKYSEKDDSYKFINGVLRGVLQNT